MLMRQLHDLLPCLTNTLLPVSEVMDPEQLLLCLKHLCSVLYAPPRALRASTHT